MVANRELELAWEFVEYTGKSIFLTGKAGTGKTTFLRRVVTESTKRMVVVAPTGVAAINAGGVTIHSFFQLPFSPFVPDTRIKSKFDFSKEKRKIIRTLDMLVIDEISMVRSDLLDAIDSVLRRFRDSRQPFGGVQLLMIGDLQQLTPVVTNEEATLLRSYYDTPYFFGSHALQSINYVTLELKHVYRQQDEAFISILNHIRDGRPTDDDIRELNGRCDPSFRPKPEEGYIRLTTHNNTADSYNERELSNLPGSPFYFDAEIKGVFPDYAYPTSEHLELKKGTQVMFVKNDQAPEHRYFNGKIGTVVEIKRNQLQVLCPGDDEAIDVEPQTWENTKYVLNEATKEIETEVQGSFTQLPLRLAWAITIHKSQGLTFERAVIDANASFAPGQVYVALSRCKTLEGMVLASPIDRRSVINDARVSSYIAGQENAAANSIAHLPESKEEYYRQQLKELFSFSDLIAYEERLVRVLAEFFSHSHPQLTSLHKQTLDHLKKKVAEVSLKWSLAVSRMSMEELHSSAFLERVDRGVGYFYQVLAELLDLPLEKTKGLETKNKEAQKRVGEAFAEVRLSFLSHRLLLKEMASCGFTVQNYLKAKQEAWLDAMDELNPNEKRRQRTKKKEKTQKEKKPDTKQTTYEMYRQGLSLDQIAQERKLNKRTIFSHVAHFISTGELNIEDFVDEDKRIAIVIAVTRVGRDNGLKAIREQCPDNVSYEDIILMLASL